MKGKNSYDHLKKFRKGFYKIQHSFMIKTLNTLGTEGKGPRCDKVFFREMFCG